MLIEFEGVTVHLEREILIRIRGQLRVEGREQRLIPVLVEPGAHSLVVLGVVINQILVRDPGGRHGDRDVDQLIDFRHLDERLALVRRAVGLVELGSWCEPGADDADVAVPVAEADDEVVLFALLDQEADRVDVGDEGDLVRPALLQLRLEDIGVGLGREPPGIPLEHLALLNADALDVRSDRRQIGRLGRRGRERR